MMDEKVLKREIEDRVAYLTLNRPDRSNALNRALFEELSDEIRSLEENDEVGVIVITGAGSKAFCAGIDLKERAQMNRDEILPYRERIIRPCFESMKNCTKPLIAAVNGSAFGGGAELALVCDIRIASTNAKFAQSEVKWGMMPAAGACQRLRMITGIGLAKEIIFTGSSIEAEEAYRLRIYNRVVPQEDLMAETVQMAQTIAKNSPVALRQAKKAIDVGSGIAESLDYEFEVSKICYLAGEAMTGPKEFKS